MKILALITPATGKTPADFGPLLEAEEKAVWADYRSGIIRELYVQTEPMTVTMVFEAESHAEVHAVLARFPMVAAGLLDVRVITLGPWTMFEHLFDPRHLA